MTFSQEGTVPHPYPTDRFMEYIPSVMLHPGTTLYVYGMEGQVAVAPPMEELVGIIEDGGWTYLVFTEEADAELIRLGWSWSYAASLPYEDWLDGDTQYPIDVAGLLIAAPWNQDRLFQDRKIDLVIEPSLAFGTGAHATTRRCLEWMADLIQLDQIERVLDLGCGTGVLSLAALRLGAREAAGCDTSALAVEVAQRNAERNGLANRAVFEKASAQDFARPADLVLANLPPAALDELLGHPALRQAPWVISSGLLAGDLDRLRRGLPEGLELYAAAIDGPWHTALLRRNMSSGDR